MVWIDMPIPTNCYDCWIRQNMGCRIANESGWLNNRRDEKCPINSYESRTNEGIKDAIFALQHPHDCNEDDVDIARKMALAALIAQDSIKPKKVNRYLETDDNGNWHFLDTYDCGHCGAELPHVAYYCPLCGRSVKWK